MCSKSLKSRQIIEVLSQDKRIYLACLKLAKRKFLADDLYQEYFLALCEIEDDRLIVAKERGQLDLVCIGILNNIWGKRNRKKYRQEGRTNPLYESPEYLNIDDLVQVNDDQLIVATEAIKIVEGYKMSDDINMRVQAKMFDYACMYKSIKQFAKESNIPRKTVSKNIEKFRIKLKDDLRKSDII